MKLILVFALLLGMVPGCSDPETVTPPEPVQVQLKWRHQAQFAGIYMAMEKGFYTDQNLAVTSIARTPGVTNQKISQALVSGKVQFAVMGGDVLLNEISHGRPLTAVAVIFQRSPYVYASLKSSGIRRPRDLVGKTIMLPPDGEIQHNALMEKMGIPLDTITHMVYDRDADYLKTGKIHAQVVYRTGSALALEREGLDLNFIWVDDYGIRLYADAIVCTRETIDRRPHLVEAFLRATLEGWRHAIEHPGQALEVVMAQAPGLKIQEQKRMLDIQTPLIHTGDFPIGWMMPKTWEQMPGILKIPQEDLEISRAYTMDFLYRIYREAQ